MTRAKHIAIVQRAIDRALAAGFSLEQAVVAAIDRFIVAMELEQEESESGVLVDFPKQVESNPVRAHKNPDLDSDALKPPPPSQEAESGRSLIIDPSSPPPAKAPPIRIGPQGGLHTPNGAPRKYWGQSQLRDLIQEKTPDVLMVLPEGRESPVGLVRNILVLPGVELVRLSYELPDRANTVPSSPNSRGGETLPAMNISEPIFINFSTHEKEPDIQGGVDRLHKMALAVNIGLLLMG